MLIQQTIQTPSEHDATQLLLLLRESGDDDADAIRRDTPTWYSARLAAIVGNENTETLLLALVALPLVLGIVMLRRSTNAEPLVSAEAGALPLPLREAFTAILDPDTAWLWSEQYKQPRHWKIPVASSWQGSCSREGWRPRRGKTDRRYQPSRPMLIR